MIEKLRECFSDQVVYKDLTKDSFFQTLGLPSFLRDWLLRHFEEEDGTYDPDEIRQFVKDFIPTKDDWESVKAEVVLDSDRKKILAQVIINVDVRTGDLFFELPDLAISAKDTYIERVDYDTFRDDVKVGIPVWGKLTLGYKPPEKKEKGKIKLVDFENFCPYEVDPDYYKDARGEFTVSEWIDVLLGAMDYNANGYESEQQKLAMLTRLLPFVEKRLNLIELAPKGTGKSYLFGRVSRYGWLSSGGTMSRAKMFYDMRGKGTEGLVAFCDYVALDEVQTITFSDIDEMRSALKGYMESGQYTVGKHHGTGDAGIVLLGNIDQKRMTRGVDMFVELPYEFHESALLDRFHGFIEGWNIPRMNNSLKVSGWALNSEYFCTIMHLLRSDGSYRAVVDEIIEVPARADTRDTEAVKRTATAWLKLLFPNVRTAADISAEDFTRYCLEPALHMRGIILEQLGLMDPGEFGGKKMPELKARDVYGD